MVPPVPMPALRGRLLWAVVSSYVCVAIAFSWPLPLHASTQLPGPAGGDTGVYVWNLWVFRHEILHGHFPFFTHGILSQTSSYGNYSADYQYFQTVHGKPLMGGYLSRLPRKGIGRYREIRLMRVLLDMSAGEQISGERFERALLSSEATLADLNVKYVAINTERAPPQLVDFARRGFGMTEASGHNTPCPTRR